MTALLLLAVLPLSQKENDFFSVFLLLLLVMLILVSLWLIIYFSDKK